MGKFVEIRDAALLAAKEEIIAAQKHAQKMAQAKEELIEQLIAKENELESVRGLVDKNQQLQQRIKDLEKALEDSNRHLRKMPIHFYNCISTGNRQSVHVSSLNARISI